ncbi:MAG: ribosome biogenesis GTP-binding protein YihA/YsxC [Bacteroidia bacterium]|nr:ribosome biogenesis GTP-binding protein YihA/YsxC [Bacteroidia bacterium]MDW8334587.1 ribosome biogenesis GTP-binding protein YihA/YsxC [Bacteroidia bacterium]
MSNSQIPRIEKAEFVLSVANLGQLPPADRPEYAFVGRSNVGKSSLINYLCGRKELAKTSATPGKTQTLNYFSINDSWYLVDLPGYGYAQVSKQRRARFKDLIADYLTTRFSLVHTFLLLDVRREPMASDLEFIQFLGESELSFSLVFTKADKLNATATEAQIESYRKLLLETWEELPPMYLTSATHRRGAEPILAAIAEYNRISRQEIRRVFELRRRASRKYGPGA